MNQWGQWFPEAGARQTHPGKWLNTDSLAPPLPRGSGVQVWGGSWEPACKQAPPLLRRLQTTLWWPLGYLPGLWAGIGGP